MSQLNAMIDGMTTKLLTTAKNELLVLAATLITKKGNSLVGGIRRLGDLEQ